MSAARPTPTPTAGWIGEDGFPIAERAGVLRWFVRVDGELRWGDAPAEAIAGTGLEPSDARSLTFVPAKLGTTNGGFGPSFNLPDYRGPELQSP